MASASLDTITEIDGSYLEGGGQILRISTALSAILNKPLKITKIRQCRKDGGLKAQHLTGIKLIGEISRAKLIGAEINSKELQIIPTELNSGEYLGDTKTAGSIILLIQATLPCLLFTKEESKLHLRGGTNAEHAPQVDYFQLVFTPIAKNLGIKTECEILRRGYYPKGNGEVYLKIYPVLELNPIDLTDFGSLKRIYGRAFVAGPLPIDIAKRMGDSATQEIRHKYKDIPIEIELVKEPEHTYIGVGCGLILIAETTTGMILAGSGLGKKGVPAEKVGADAAQELMHDLKFQSCVDQYMQDQLIIFMALANGKSKIKTGPLTLHTETAIYFAQKLTDATFVVNKVDSGNIIECTGIGFKNKFLK